MKELHTKEAVQKYWLRKRKISFYIEVREWFQAYRDTKYSCYLILARIALNNAWFAKRLLLNLNNPAYNKIIARFLIYPVV